MARLHKHLSVLTITAALALVAFPRAWPVAYHDALATQVTHDKSAPHAREHEFGDAFVVSLGGKLYDNYWEGSGASPPAMRNPSFPPDLTVSDTDSWRCVSCHGWDYEGAAKADGSAQQQKQFIGLRHLQGTDPFNMLELFTKAHPDQNALSSGGLPLDLLLLFITVGQYDPENFRPEKSLSQKSLSRGRDIFEGVCMSCHDPNGKSGFEVRPGMRGSLGWQARNQPKRMIHKIINGVPGESMLALRFMDEPAIADLVAYLKTLDPDADQAEP
jgi:thiosulfate dehydrogenase